MTSEFLQPLLIGIMVMIAIFIGLRLSLNTKERSIIRAVAIFAAAGGFLTTFWLVENPEFLSYYSKRIVVGGLTAVLALIALARLYISRK
jgi:hypothetical protein